MKYSIAARSLPSGLRIGVTASGHSCVGAIIRKPSGSRCSRPRRTTNVRRYAGLVCIELIGQPQPLAEVDAPGDRGDEVVGALFDLKAVAVDASKARRPAAAPASKSVKRHAGRNSISRCAAASPAMPPPMTASCKGLSGMVLLSSDNSRPTQRRPILRQVHVQVKICPVGLSYRNPSRPARRRTWRGIDRTGMECGCCLWLCAYNFHVSASASSWFSRSFQEAMPWRNLYSGCTGQDVRNLQLSLNCRPPSELDPLKDDGIFGPKTLARVKEYQANNDLVADGIVGPKTRAALSGSGPQPPDCSCACCTAEAAQLRSRSVAALLQTGPTPTGSASAASPAGSQAPAGAGSAAPPAVSSGPFRSLTAAQQATAPPCTERAWISPRYSFPARAA